MLTKLAFKNVGKSFKEYAIYFVTLALAVCIFYIFNAVEAQKAVMEINRTQYDTMKALTEVMKYLSVFVAIILGLLIVYANNFFIKRRKKELGVYLTLGMERGKISAILVLETSVIAIFALIIGIISGVFLSQFMSLFTTKMFGADLSAYKFVFSMAAVIKSILYFGVIFITVIAFNTITISKYKLIDLIYADRKNESLKTKNIKVSFVLFVIAIMSLSGSYYLIMENAKGGIFQINFMVAGGVLLGVIGTILFFFSLTGFLITLIQKNKKVYFKDLNMFVLRQINSKINTNFSSMSVICILLFLSISILSMGISVEAIFSSELENMSYPYDVTVAGRINEKAESVVDILEKDINIKDYVKEYDEYTEYITEDIQYKDILTDIPEDALIFPKEPLKFITLTEYNEILEMKDKSPVTLKDDSYIIVSKNEAILPQLEEIVKSNTALDLGDKKVYPQKEVQKIDMKNEYKSPTYFVVNDYMVSEMKQHTVIANINCLTFEEAEKLEGKLYPYSLENSNLGTMEFYGYSSKAFTYKEYISSKVLIPFIAIYVGFVFLITSVAILALQQVSEAADNKKRYDLLLKLGVDEPMINRALFRQIACYFILPLSLAILHSVVGLNVGYNLIKDSIEGNLLGSIVLTAGVIILIYSGYFVATFISSKNIINK